MHCRLNLSKVLVQCKSCFVAYDYRSAYPVIQYFNSLKTLYSCYLLLPQPAYILLKDPYLSDLI